jgi:hypothetical protein
MNRLYAIFLIPILFVVVIAQQDILIKRKKVIVKDQAATPGVQLSFPGEFPETAPLHDTMVFVSSEMALDGKPIKGAPYSAEAITEITQSLSDGNKIYRKSTASIYRDSEGRTRREQSLIPMGFLGFSANHPKTIFINDPAAGVNYIIHPEMREARKISAPTFHLPVAKFEMTEREGSISFAAKPSFAREIKKEKLGVDTIEGVKAEGSRDIITIPAGQIGNERAIEIVTELWYSPELRTTVLRRHNDPRFGETIYKLTNINRTEQPKSLFEIPEGYKVADEGQFIKKFRLKKDR